jgi:ABC-2 type transport system ATP-binding protein
MLALVGLRKRFGAIEALTDVSFEVGDGQLLGFLGPNGSGKTTTMRSILGLVRLDAGTVSWNGAAVGSAQRSRFGYMPEERGLYPRMAVRNQVVYFARLAGLGSRSAGVAADTWLERLALSDRRGDTVQSLSHGNQQRVQLAVALVHDPELLVLDEPFSGLDPIGVESMQQLLVERAAAGVSVLFSSHQLDLVEDLCRDVVIINRGRVVLAGSVDEVRATAPNRTLVVHFDHDVDPGWVAALPGASLLEADGRVQRFAVPANIDLGAALARAQSVGALMRFSFEPPDLSEVFRGAVSDVGGTDREVVEGPAEMNGVGLAPPERMRVG